jgi:branched-chain amino acid transport system substrate-binding protein
MSAIDRRLLVRMAMSLPFLSLGPPVLPVVLPAEARARTRGLERPAALLLPLSGPSAALGSSLERAAAMLQSGDGPPLLRSFDTGGTPEGAAHAARRCLRERTELILGPLFSSEVGPVLDVAGDRAQVISLSNDAALRGSGAFLLGITASQLVTALLGYARSRGVRRVAVAAGPDDWSRQVADAARAVETELGVAVSVLPADGAGTVDRSALATVPGGSPEALLVAGGGDAAVAQASLLRGTGIQLLVPLPAIDYAAPAMQALAGAWISAHDPSAFGVVARAFEAERGRAPGAIAALAFDAATVARTLAGRPGEASLRARLLAARFGGVTGAFRFRADGSCEREITVLAATGRDYVLVDRRLAA